MQLKLTAAMLLATCLHVSAGTLAQNITFSGSNVPLKKVFAEIKKQSGYTVFCNYEILQDAHKVNVNVTHASIQELLARVLKDQGLDYTIENKMIAISRKKPDPGNDDSSRMPFAFPPIRVTGRVIDQNGTVLAGANVTVKGGTRSVLTDRNGDYSISVETDDKLVFSFVGYETVELSVGGKTELNATLNISVANLNETVVIGYGSQRKADLTAAVSTMKSTEIALIPTSNLSNVLAGRLSGTFVQTNTGTPGISSGIRVRATSTFNSDASKDPVYVIDGVVRDKTSFDALDPNEVDEISVLKDAASAAIYGSRSSNGVLLVTTKMGKSGKPQISYSTTFSSQKPAKMPEYMDITTSLKMNRYIFGENNITAEEEADMKSWNPDGRAWYNAAYQNPTDQRHALSIAGGTDRITYYLGGSFYGENGFLPNVWYKKYNLRGKVSANLTKDLSVGLNLSNSYGTRNRFNFTYDYGSDDLNNLWGKLFYNGISTRPYVDGNPVNPGWLGNQIEMMRNGGYWRNNNQQVDALINIDYKVPFVNGLSLHAAFSKNFDNSHVKNFAKKQLLYNYQMTANGVIDTSKFTGTVLSGDPGTEYIGNEYTGTNSYQLNGQINYDRIFGLHHISAVAVYEQYESNYSFFSTYRYNFPLFPTDQFFAASGNSSDWTNNANETQDGRLSYVARVNYEYSDKYLLSASVRRDGSIRFAPDKRWGSFPSVAAGWKISRENFFTRSQGLSNFIDLLKLRLSYAATGNDAIANSWAWQDQFNIATNNYYMGTNGTTYPRLTYGGIPNTDLTWEKSNSLNLGLDLNFLGKFSLTTEFWRRHTYDILGARVLAIPAEFGANLPSTNYGVVDSKGLEVELGYNTRIGKDFLFNVKGNFGLATNKVIKQDVAAGAIPVDDPNGKSLNYMIGYQSTGIYRTQADLDKLPAGFTILGQEPVLGMLAFADVNGPDGKPDGKVDNYDRVKIANYQLAQAPISYGLNLNFEYKGFSVNALFAGLAGFKIFYNDAFGRNTGSYFVYTKFWEDYWTETNVDAKAPKPFPWGDSRATYTNNSTYNAYDGSFVRMKYLSFGYRLPSSLIRRAGLHGVQLFASGTNLFVLSKFKYYDPEVSQFMSYPIMKTFSLGFNVNL